MATHPHESTPLIPSSLPGEIRIGAVDSGKGNKVWAEVWIVVKTSIPVALTYMLQNSLQTACVLIVGRSMGADELAAAAFAFMFAMVTAWVMAMGSTTALDTLGSQAWTGAEDPHEVGVHLQRAILILTVLFIPIAGLWWWAEPVLLLLGQEPELSRMSALFLRWLLIGAPGYIYFEAIKKYLQAQGIMHAGTYVLLIASPLNILLNYLFVAHPSYSLGFIGAPIATSITYWVMLLLIILYVRFVDGMAGWGGLSRRSLTGWWSFLRLALPGILMIGSEWWAFEIVALAAGLLGKDPLAAQSVIMTTDQVLNTIPFGISIATSNRVGNLIGLGWARRSSLAARVSAGAAAVAGGIVMVVLLMNKDSFGYLFSDDAEVAQLVADVMPWVAAFQIADGLAGSCGGSLRGMGRQHVGAYVNLGAYYAFALPLGMYLAFREGFGLQGLWIGQCVALFLVGFAELAFVLRTDYSAEVLKCKERLMEDAEAERSHA